MQSVKADMDQVLNLKSQQFEIFIIKMKILCEMFLARFFLLAILKTMKIFSLEATTK